MHSRKTTSCCTILGGQLCFSISQMQTYSVSVIYRLPPPPTSQNSRNIISNYDCSDRVPGTILIQSRWNCHPKSLKNLRQIIDYCFGNKPYTHDTIDFNTFCPRVTQYLFPWVTPYFLLWGAPYFAFQGDPQVSAPGHFLTLSLERTSTHS